MKKLLILLTLLAILPLQAQEADAILRDWIAKQAGIQSLRAEFIQTRRLPALRIPLRKSGVVCFGSDGRFRWQVGDPVELIVLKTPAGCMVAEPKKSIVRHLDSSSPAAAAIHELPFPFALSLDDFHHRFEVVSLKKESGKIDLLLTPKDIRLAEGLKTLRVNFDAASGAVHLFEMTFRDGSQVATEFTCIEINPKLDDSLFLLRDS